MLGIVPAMQTRKRCLSLSLEIILGLIIIATGIALFAMREEPMLQDTLQIQCCDEGDYRYLAEHFWGIPHDLSTYAEDFHGYWGTVLENVPFRDLGAGTAYLLLDAFGLSRALSAHLFLVLMLASSSLCFFIFTSRMIGTARAALMLAILVLLPQQWLLTEKFLAEPFLRSLLILLLIPVLSLTKDTKRPVTAAMWIAVLTLLASHFKVMWVMFGVMLLPILLPTFLKKRQWAAAAILVGGIIVSPLTQSFIHAIRWGDASISGGAGLHLTGKYPSFLPFVCARSPKNAIPWNFCNQENREFIPWWAFLHEQSATTDVVHLVRSLDDAALPFLLSQPVDTIRNVGEGFMRSTNFPDTDSIVLRMIDWLTMVTLFCGLFFKRTRILSAFAVALWLVPAIGNALSAYDGRYHLIMAGLPLAIAAWILSHIPRSALQKLRKSARNAVIPVQKRMSRSVMYSSHTLDNVLRIRPPLQLLCIILFLGFLLRFSVIQNPGWSFDVGEFKSWAWNITEMGGGEAYRDQGRASMLPNYPPMSMLILGGVGHVYRFFIASEFDGAPLLYHILIKLPAILFDLLTAALLFFLLRRIRTERAGIIAAAVYAFHPAVLYDSAVWGQTDGIFTCFMVAAIAATAWKRWILVGTFAALAMLTKFQAVVILPFVALLMLLQNWRVALRIIFGAFAVTALVLIPFLPDYLGDIWHVYTHSIGYYPGLTYGAYNTWLAFFDGSPHSSTDMAIGLLSYRDIGIMIFGGVIAILVYRFAPGLRSALQRKKHQELLLLFPALTAYAFFLFNTEMHERYLFPLMALGIGFIFFSRLGAWLYGLSSLLFFLNLLGVLHWTEADRMLFEIPHLPRTIGFAHTVLFVLWVAVIAHKISPPSLLKNIWQKVRRYRVLFLRKRMR